MKICKGTNRVVILCGKFAFKIPNFLNGHLLFLHGCLANWRERYFCKVAKSSNIELYNHVAPSLFCSWFGLLQIQIRCTKNTLPLLDKDLKVFEIISSDVNICNTGWYKHRLVLFDYGD